MSQGCNKADETYGQLVQSMYFPNSCRPVDPGAHAVPCMEVTWFSLGLDGARGWVV